MKRLTRKQFKLPNAISLKGRRSTIAKSFSDGIAPRIAPLESEYAYFSALFGKNNGTYSCSYCGDPSDYYEHFRPLVKNAMPTGFGSDIYNLVPSCNYCNVRKGNSNWQEWMSEVLTKRQPDPIAHQQRYEILEQFDTWGDGKVCHIPYEQLVGTENWQKYLASYQQIIELLHEIAPLQQQIRNAVALEARKHATNRST